MKAPDKIYIGIQELDNGYVYALSLDNNGEQEYVRKDALLEWATTNRDKLDVLSDNDAVRWGQRNAFQQMIDKLNQM